MSIDTRPIPALPKRPPSAEQYICALIASFPCLRSRLRYTPESWDCDDLGKMLGVLSTGERYAALFILNVWNPGYAHEKGWVFEVVDACGTWGSDNRAAFIAWAQNPYWP